MNRMLVIFDLALIILYLDWYGIEKSSKTIVPSFVFEYTRLKLLVHYIRFLFYRSFKQVSTAIHYYHLYIVIQSYIHNLMLTIVENICENQNITSQFLSDITL
jgi:hypothetical protein